MAIRKIFIWPEPELKVEAKLVVDIDSEIKTLIQDMFATMYHANGIGLAATQLGIPIQVLVIDLDPKQEAQQDPELQENLSTWGFQGPRAFVNPHIKLQDGEIVWKEGCLSVPGIHEDVTRCGHVVVEAMDEQGQLFTIEARGLYAVALQHEIDHLHGKVFVDHISKLKRDIIRKKMDKLKSEGIDDGVRAALAL